MWVPPTLLPVHPNPLTGLAALSGLSGRRCTQSCSDLRYQRVGAQGDLHLLRCEGNVSTGTGVVAWVGVDWEGGAATKV